MTREYYVIRYLSDVNCMWFDGTHGISGSVYEPYSAFERRCDAEVCLVLFLSGKRIDKSLYDCCDLRKTQSLASVLSKRNMEFLLEKHKDRYRIEKVQLGEQDIAMLAFPPCECLI